MEQALNFTPIALTLSLAFLGGFILHRLRQPVLVGYILAGALAGPFLLEGNAHTIAWLSEIAIILLMFMLGLELDVARFKRSMRQALLITGIQIALSLGVMLGFVFLFERTWQLGILLGFVVALSSTAVAVNMLQNLGETNSSAGRLAIAILIAQDLAAIPMLLIVSALGAGAFESVDLVRFGFAISVIFVTLLGIFELHQHPQWVARLERILTTGKSQPVIAGLACAFGAAALSGALGISHAYGAFAAGLLIGNIGTMGASYRHAVHSIHDLLMMAFFLFIGFLLDLSFILDHWLEITTVVLATLFLKTAVNVGLLHYLLGVSKRTSFTLGAVLGQIGEFSFVLIALGLSSGFITKGEHQFILAIIALSLACSPILLQGVQSYLGRSVRGS